MCVHMKYLDVLVCVWAGRRACEIKWNCGSSTSPPINTEQKCEVLQCLWAYQTWSMSPLLSLQQVGVSWAWFQDRM